MVEIFKTNIYKNNQCKDVIEILLKYNPFCKINFDLEDCDRIMRIEAASIDSKFVNLLLAENGFECEVLPD